VDLNGCEADLAVGCGYKYFNGGPGAPAFAYVAERHHAALQQPLTGWMGHASPFAFTDDYAPAAGIDRLLTGTPPILGMAALEEGVRIIAEIGIARLVAKSRALSEFLSAAIAQIAPDLPCVSPEDPATRGSQLSYRHPEAYALCQALIGRGVIPDFREPDVLRLGLAPAYLRFEDCWHAAQALGEVLASGEWRADCFASRRKVT
jgi:kynureninase